MENSERYPIYEEECVVASSIFNDLQNISIGEKIKLIHISGGENLTVVEKSDKEIILKTPRETYVRVWIM